MHKNKFKVGDLVVLTGLDGVIGYKHIINGELGVIVEVISLPVPEMPLSMVSFFFDYLVLVNGTEIMLFEEELREYPIDYKPCVACDCDPCDCEWGIE